ncbi:DUF1016 family protein [bacterium]|nr:DUF1016 family protein [bacterium]
MKGKTNNDFDQLVCNIANAQKATQSLAIHAINIALTARNWLIGYYIVEYEQNGEDRARYGEQLLNKLSKKLNKKGLESRRLREFRQVYLVYPELAAIIERYAIKEPAFLVLGMENQKWRLPTAKFEDKIEAWKTAPDKLFYRLSATHLIMLSGISDPLKRAFYEQEAIRGCWTVKELDRQISSLFYERMGLSKNKNSMQNQATEKNALFAPSDIIHDPVSLEFLGLHSQDIFTETKLESAILDHLQHFLLEMGTGFCFEARQKRILIDKDYFKADLVFYHRILKCHVIVDLKIDRFRHEYASQMNLYLNYFRHEIMQEGDNPPIGILLCTDYGETTVRYATEGLAPNLFVSKYRVQLPSESEIREYLLKNISPEDFGK